MLPLLTFDWKIAASIFRKEVGKDQIMIAGIDEVGRGTLAGPVVAGCVHFPAFTNLIHSVKKEEQEEAFWSKITDSKRLLPKQRVILSEQIKEHSQWGVGAVTAAQIDEIGIATATRLAAYRAYCAMGIPVDLLLLDGAIASPSVNSSNIANLWSLQGKEETSSHRASIVIHSITRGDSYSLHIAAASIVAKVFRDQLMVSLDQAFPQYGFAAHKGYPTAAHCRAIARYGLSPLHRHTFARKHKP
ncbi:ribonuclease HII [Candidatus Acetothermia bacterium]|nr:ribonuclease HII [Candidatus Acetothermia bacterium]